jgi:U5 small nuclear ribonucleoprotein component
MSPKLTCLRLFIAKSKYPSLLLKNDLFIYLFIFKKRFMVDMMNTPDLIRNIAVVGHLHHGKTSFVDMLISETHDIPINVDQPERYTDTHILERDRGLSIKSMPVTLVMQDIKEKSYLLNILDTPGNYGNKQPPNYTVFIYFLFMLGHTNFIDEVVAATRLADGVAIVVDVVEGVMVNTEQVIKHCVREGLAMTLVVNKVDRLMLELKIPPADAYFKLRHTIEEVNSIIR